MRISALKIYRVIWLTSEPSQALESKDIEDIYQFSMARVGQQSREDREDATLSAFHWLHLVIYEWTDVGRHFSMIPLLSLCFNKFSRPLLLVIKHTQNETLLAPQYLRCNCGNSTHIMGQYFGDQLSSVQSREKSHCFLLFLYTLETLFGLCSAMASMASRTLL